MSTSAVPSILRRLTLLGLLSLLVACATPPASAPLTPRPPRESITRFNMEGRIIIRQAQRADSVRLAWQHSGEADFLGFASPLGNMMAELQRDANGARWLTADGERFESRRPDELFARLTNTPVPLDALSEWVLGRLTKNADSIVRDAQGRALSATDRGWEIKFMAYESEAANALPSVLEVSFEKLRIRLAVDAWML